MNDYKINAENATNIRVWVGVSNPEALQRAAEKLRIPQIVIEQGKDYELLAGASGMYGKAYDLVQLLEALVNEVGKDTPK